MQRDIIHTCAFPPYVRKQTKTGPGIKKQNVRMIMNIFRLNHHVPAFEIM